ncbi:MAG: hypothetical protein ACYC9P_05135 [Rudaea sp.]
MFVLVVDVGKVGVGVHQRLVGVRMRMRLAAVPFEVVRVLVMRVVHMGMRVCDRLMHVQVLVTLGQVQPVASIKCVLRTRCDPGFRLEKRPWLQPTPASPRKGTDEIKSGKIMLLKADCCCSSWPAVWLWCDALNQVQQCGASSGAA